VSRRTRAVVSWTGWVALSLGLGAVVFVEAIIHNV
jgi:hypothetical protein